jgi:glycosyltransferase involved in cell wall biosynthesis
VLCDAWRRVVTGCDASLVVVGGGPESGGLERWIHRHDLSGSVFLTGERPDPQSYYRAADIFAFPSREEGFGNVLAEAMAHGLAIVSRPVGLAQHFIEDDRNGMIVREPSPDVFAAAIDALLRDDARRERLGREARRTALMNFAPAVVTSSCLGLYERLERD